MEGCGVSGGMSEYSSMTHGSVQRPMQFIISINDLPVIVDSELKLFEDDTKLHMYIQGGWHPWLIPSPTCTVGGPEISLPSLTPHFFIYFPLSNSRLLCVPWARDQFVRGSRLSQNDRVNVKTTTRVSFCSSTTIALFPWSPPDCWHRLLREHAPGMTLLIVRSSSSLEEKKT